MGLVEVRKEWSWDLMGKPIIQEIITKHSQSLNIKNMTKWKWKSSYDEEESLDWLLLRNGPVIKYYSLDILENDLTNLEKLNYQIFDLVSSNWNTNNFHEKLKEGLDFPEYYGENKAAFEDS